MGLKDALTAEVDLRGMLHGLVAWAMAPLGPIEPKKRLPDWAPIAAFFLFLLLLATRYFVAFVGPPFVADDGKFFELAWNHGASSILAPYHGYVNLVPGLTGYLASKLPLDVAPFLFAWLALTIQAAVAAAMLSKRVAAILPSEWSRIALAALIVMYPSYVGVQGNIAHAQWYMAIWALVVLLTPRKQPARGVAWDCAFLLILALTGPLGILLLPFALWKWKERWHYAATLIPVCAIQLHFLLAEGRMDAPGHKRFATVVGMLASKVWDAVFDFPVGASYSPNLYISELERAVLLVLVLGFVAIRGPALLRALTALAAICFVVALKSGSTWYGLGISGQGERYFFLLGIALAAGFAHIVQLPMRRCVRLIPAWGLLLCAISIGQGWFLTSDRKLHYQAIFDAAPEGTVSIPIASSSGQWYMELEKPRPK